MSAYTFVNSVAQNPLDWNWSITPVAKTTRIVNTIQDLGVGVTHVKGENGRGGVTIGYRKQNDDRNCRMVEVALCYCSPQDTFTKKIGTHTVLEKFLSDETFLVPARTDKTDDSIVSNLQDMFWYSVN